MTNSPEESDGQKRKRFRWGVVLAGLILLPMLYVLSVPFVWKAVILGWIPVSFPETIYRPIAWLGEITPLVNDFYEWYFSFFGKAWFMFPP